MKLQLVDPQSAFILVQLPSWWPPPASSAQPTLVGEANKSVNTCGIRRSIWGSPGGGWTVQP